ncbi:MAG: glycosyltransferase family 39 protein, partial [Candidatus Eisenbacteria bacterium]|nr:glycosyltransferase family 39 protein [Candidatus Eisenbacteria bacterium]
SIRHPDFPYYGLIEESFHRMTTGQFHRGGPVYYYLPVMLGVCFAWSVLVPGAIVWAWRRRERWTSADRLLVVWGLVVVVFFSLSKSKLPGYVLPAVVALSMLIARLFDRALATVRNSAADLVRRTNLGLIIGALLPMAWLLLEVLRPGWISGAFGIDSRDYVRSRVFFPGALVVLGLIVALSVIGLRRRSVTALFGAYLVFPLCLLTIDFGGLRTYADGTSSKGLAREVATIAPQASVAMLECYANGLAYYLGRSPVLVTRDGRETTSNYVPFYLERQAEWPAPVVPHSELAAWLAQREGALLVLARKRGRDELNRIANQEGAAPAREITPGWWAALLPSRGGS